MTMARLLLVLVAAGCAAVVGSSIATSAMLPPLAAQGHVYNAYGNPVEGATMALVDEPDTDGEVSISALATATTDATGYYALYSRQTTALADEASQNDGYNNLAVVGAVGDVSYYDSLERTYDLVHHWEVDSSGGIGNAVDGSDGGGGVFDDVAPAPDSSFAAGTGPSPWCFPWTKTLVATERGSTAIGEIHTAWDINTAYFKYGQTADSSIDVGFSGDGTHWSVAGSLHIGNTQGSTGVKHNVTSDNYGHLVNTDMEYGKYRYRALCWNGWHTWYDVRARKWLGGVYEGTDVSALDHNCRNLNYAPFSPGDETWRDFGKYKRFSSAVTLSFGGIGLTLGARSGLSRWVKQDWKFGTQPGLHYLCGNDGPMTTSSRVFAGW